MALDLVRGLSADSYVSKKLWRTIRNLRELVPRFSSGRTGSMQDSSDGIYQAFHPDQQQQNEAQRSAAMVMAGLATGQPLDETAFFAENAQSSNDLNSNITRNDHSGKFASPMKIHSGFETCLGRVLEFFAIARPFTSSPNFRTKPWSTSEQFH